MKQFYELADGKVAEVEVKADIAHLLADFERKDKNAARNKRRRNEISLDDMYDKTGFEPTDTSVDIEKTYITNEEIKVLRVALFLLSDKQRRLIQFRYYEEKTESKIAAILGVSQQAINQQLLTLHKKLKKLLEKTL